MPEIHTTYKPVYHFLDDTLFRAFLDKIPRRELMEVLRHDAELRNRCFPGFRITESSPTKQQFLAAFAREIRARHNASLGNLLCRHWIRASQELTRTGLESIGIPSHDASDIRLWLDGVQKKLSRDGLASVSTLVRSLSPQFSREDVLNFISIISYGQDQQSTKELAEREVDIQSATKIDPQHEKEQLEKQLESARTKLLTLEQSRQELDHQLERELATARAEVDDLSRKHADVELVISNTRAGIATLTEKIDELKRSLATQEQVLKEQDDLKNKLSTTLKRLRERLAATIANQNGLRKDTEERHRDQMNLISRLAAEVAAVEVRIQVAKATPAPRTVPLAAAEVGAASRMPAVTATGNEMLRNNAICYQGLQRTFRNALVGFLRERLPLIFPDDHTQRMRSVFGDQWDTAAKNAAKSRAIGGTSTTVRDDYDLLGTNHFFELFDRFYDKLFTPAVGQPSDLPKPVKTKFLGNLKAIKDGRDPLSHPVDEEVSFEEAHHLLIEAKQILSWLGYESQAAELSALAGQLGGGEIEMPPIVRRLPSEDSIYQEFVGRDTVLTDLAACFTNPDNRRALLAGDGGKGKSAVAYRFAQGLSKTPGRFQLIVWLSAKRRKFQEGKSTAIELPDFTTAAEAIDRLLEEYGATESDLAISPEKKRELLMEYLETLPAFIIADDIDTVLEDYEVVSLFTHDIPHTQSAVLLTSRRDIPGVRSFVLKGFDAAEAAEFVRSRIHLYGLDVAAFSPSIISEIARATDGSPLYMDDLLRLTRVLSVKDAIRMWTEKKGDEARKYALERELEKLTVDAKRVLIAAAINDAPISFAELERILELSEDRLYSALNELQTLFLVPKPRLVEGEQRFQINLNTKKLVRLVESASDMYARIDRARKLLAGELPDAGKGVVGSLIRQAYLRLNAQKPLEAEAILKNGIDAYPNVPDLRGFLGYAYKRDGRLSDARAQFEAAATLKGGSREMFLHWMKMEMGAKEWSKAIRVSELGLKSHPEFYEMVELRANAYRQAGFDLHRGLHRDKAAKMWTDAVEVVRQAIKDPEDLPAGARQLNSSMFRTIVICLDMLGRTRERNEWLKRWENEHPEDSDVARQKEILRSKHSGHFAEF